MRLVKGIDDGAALGRKASQMAASQGVARCGADLALRVATAQRLVEGANAAYGALVTSNPTQPLPPEYPDDRAFFTITFYFNENPGS